MVTVTDHTIMPSENLNMEELTDERRKGIEESIRTIGLVELKALGDELFPYLDHPWHQRYFSFLNENAGCTFYYAKTRDRLHFVYCQEKDEGMWFLGDSGRGPLQEKGRKIFKEIIERKKP